MGEKLQPGAQCSGHARETRAVKRKMDHGDHLSSHHLFDQDQVTELAWEKKVVSLEFLDPKLEAVTTDPTTSRVCVFQVSSKSQS